MDMETNLTEVFRALQDIISAPTSATSQLRTGKDDHESKFHILPQNIPRFVTPNIDWPVSSKQQPNGQKGTTLARVGSHLATTILPHLNLSSLSPNYYGFVTGGATPAALLGDFLTSIFDQNLHAHLPNESLATTLEVATLNMLVQLFRLPEAEWAIGKKESPGGGIFTTGATASNVLGLALGREFVVQKALQRRRTENSLDIDDSASLSCGECGLAELMIDAGVRKIQVLSTLPHSSISKAASIVGIGRRNIVSIAMPNDPLQIDIVRLQQEASKQDVVSILAVSAGEVNTGRFATKSLEQWTQIRQICDENGVWIHVDGAFGLFGRLFSEREEEHTGYEQIAEGVRGLELADSITGDCHKLLNVPYDCGVFFTRHKSLMEDVSSNGNAAYLTSAAKSSYGFDDGFGAIQSPMNIGIENSRRFRALPVYTTLMAYGREGYLDMLKRQIGLARRVTRWLLHDDRFEVLPSATSAEKEKETLAKTFIVVLFRAKDDNVMKTLVKSINGTGRIYVTGTVWDGKAAARIAVSNWQVDVERDGRLIESVLDEVVGQSNGIH